MVLLEICIFIIALIVLVLASDWFVKASASIAEKIGMSEFMIGLTLVALGTSVPELASSVIAALQGESGLIIGNIVGSNIANIGLIVGIAALVSAIKTQEKMLIRDGYIMLFASVLFFLFALNHSVPFWGAILLILLYFSYIIFLFETRNLERDQYHFRAFIPYFFKFQYIVAIHKRIVRHLNRDKTKVTVIIKEGLVNDFMLLFISAIAIYFGAKYFVSEAIFFAGFFGVPTTIIGVSLVAFGTSVPELSVSLTAARKGYGDIAVGNIIGSNIANILLVAGVSGTITRLAISDFTALFTVPIMLIMSVLLLVFIKSKWKIHRKEGLAFLVLYTAFIGFLIYLS